MTPNESRPQLGQVSLTALVVANMIGAGVFTTSGFALSDLGDRRLVMLAWAVGGVIAYCGAVSYGRLVQRITRNGGEYTFLSDMVHPSVGFVAGWISIVAGFAGAAAFAASAFDAYAMPKDIRPEWMGTNALPTGLVITCTLLHAFHTGRGAIGQNIVVLIKLSAIALFLIIALAKLGGWVGRSEPNGTDSESATFVAFGTTLMWISLSYSGFNAAVYASEEALGGDSFNQAQLVRRAMLRGCFVVTIVYLLLNFVFLYGPSSSEVAGQEDVAAIAAAAIGGDRLAWILRVIVSIGLASSVSSILMAGSRVVAKMSEDELLPRFFAYNGAAPTAAVVALGALTCVIIASTALQNLLSYLGVTLAVSSAATVSTLLFSAKHSESESPRVFDRFAPMVYVGATLCFVALAALGRPVEVALAFVTISVGFVLYKCVSRS